MSEVKPQVREVQLLRVTHLCVTVYVFLSVFLSVSHTESSPVRLQKKKKKRVTDCNKYLFTQASILFQELRSIKRCR